MTQGKVINTFTEMYLMLRTKAFVGVVSRRPLLGETSRMIAQV